MEFERITREEPSQRAIWKYLSPVFYQAKRVPTCFVSKEEIGIVVNKRRRTVEYQRLKGSTATDLQTLVANVPIPHTQESFFLEVKLNQGPFLLLFSIYYQMLETTF